MTNKKTLADVINNQNCIIVTLKNLEKHMEYIQNRLVKIEDSHEGNSLIKIKEDVTEYFQLIDKKIEGLNGEIDIAENKIKKRKNVKSTAKKCEICEATFVRYCDLESHIEETHGDPGSFNCEECGKTFVVKWRLEKHKGIHTKLTTTKRCKYFDSKTFCPFERLGCKFLHCDSPDANENIVDISEIAKNTDTMKTSTPIRSILSKEKVQSILPCLENCTAQRQCTNCFVKLVLQNSEGEIDMNDSCFS